jgi:8-oxo-dGTP diphosphatase
MVDFLPVPRIGVGVMVLRKNKILLMKRRGSHGEGQWNLPGGHLDFGETIAQCAKREIWEETGLKVAKSKLICVNEDLNFLKTDHKHYMTLGVLVEIERGEPEIKEPEKCVQQSWFALEDLPEPMFKPSLNIIKAYERRVISVTS